MAGIDQATLANAVAGWGNATVEILAPSPQIRALIPEGWWLVAESPDPEERKRAALSLWNAEFLDLVPRFGEALRSALLDVRVAQHSWQGTPSLDYVLRSWDGEFKVWMGEDARTFGASEPPMFDSLPVPARTFLRQVHAGFTTLNGRSCGLMPPADMQTLADSWGHPEESDIAECWDASTYPFPGTQRLLLITEYGGHPYLFTSPDLPAGTAATYFEPDFEVTSFGEALDDFLNKPLGY
ncbi:hypothetical protein A5761_00860 [Mycolicibacterium setense]|uniref:hypothetical protein n=1 Tax=Mycolicibacterium setense TaxID=431269 RepID=UPI0007EBF7AF|nr:hypothetical protein [Mycolicibacterium setense]OBB19725.1 hypothetical protein A5761_00860 [Mycolicibacterium setense]